MKHEWQGVQEERDALQADNARLRFALENCRLLAARSRKDDWALLIIGFCAEGGVVGNIMRDEKP